MREWHFAEYPGGHDADEIVGTDGIRGTANRAPMTAEIALKVGMAAGCQFRRGRHQHRVLIGKDTRLSCYMLESALTAGFISVGMDASSWSARCRRRRLRFSPARCVVTLGDALGIS